MGLLFGFRFLIMLVFLFIGTAHARTFVLDGSLTDPCEKAMSPQTAREPVYGFWTWNPATNTLTRPEINSPGLRVLTSNFPIPFLLKRVFPRLPDGTFNYDGPRVENPFATLMAIMLNRMVPDPSAIEDGDSMFGVPVGRYDFESVLSPDYLRNEHITERGLQRHAIENANVVYKTLFGPKGPLPELDPKYFRARGIEAPVGWLYAERVAWPDMQEFDFSSGTLHLPDLFENNGIRLNLHKLEHRFADIRWQGLALDSRSGRVFVVKSDPVYGEISEEIVWIRQRRGDKLRLTGAHFGALLAIAKAAAQSNRGVADFESIVYSIIRYKERDTPRDLTRAEAFEAYAVSAYISALREMLEPFGYRIISERGEGYSLMQL